MRSPDGSYTPFNVESTFSFDALRILIAEKLDCYPGMLQLVYRLDNDKQKTPSISIRTEQELVMFMNRMRGLIVPPANKNGTQSNRALRSVTVYFENAADAISREPPSSKNSSKKACSLLPTPALN